MNRIVDIETWTKERREHLKKEKEFTRLRDELAAERRRLPWVEVADDYAFSTEDGLRSLAELFEERSQLVVYHFMYGADWEAGCKSCSFWADNFNGTIEHLNARDISFCAVSIAPLATLLAYRQRMGWSFRWVSSEGTSFNRDFGVSFTKEELASGDMTYNFAKKKFPSSEAPGATAFIRGDDGKIYRTYSTYSRGLDMLNGAYHTMDIAPKGRDEGALAYTMEWLKRRDEY